MRGCAQPLARDGRRVVCDRGHSFDVARSGYLNLLQPQDRRSAEPGDSRAAAAARRRLYEAGHGEPLVAELRRQLGDIELPPRPAVLDIGCGEGSLLGSLAVNVAIDAHGVDISTPAIELAARRWPEATWVIANADRFLPWSTAAFDVVLALSARLNRGEIARVLRPPGRLLVASPAADDLGELRAAILGEALHRDRLDRAAELLAPDFQLEARAAVRHTALLDEAGIRDALAATYRGARQSQQQRLSGLHELWVTMSFDVGRFALRRR